jgi:adenine deaminase
MLHPARYAEAVVPRGTLTVVTDLHEIANVCGLKGMKFVMDCIRTVPLDLYLMAPSCVPATYLETSGATIGIEELKTISGWEGVIGLGEVMNFPGVIMGDEQVLGKVALFEGRVVGGHAPGLGGKDLNAYLCAGIFSDHECTMLKEAEEKLRRGMYLMIREGSSEKNLATLLPLVSDKTYCRCMFVLDDSTCSDLLRDGEVDAVVRKAIKLGLDPIRAIQLATINAAQYLRLERLGAVAPGYFANLIVMSELTQLDVDMVFYKGEVVARGGQPLFSTSLLAEPELTHSMNIKPFAVEALRLPAKGGTFPIIEIIPDQIVTRRREEGVKVENGFIQPDVRRDILKLAVVERHKATGNIGLGLVHGFGLKKGALASSIAHDSHNIVAVGTSDQDIFLAVREIERLQGGLAVVAEGEVLSSLPLPIAGLLSQEPLEVVVQKLEGLEWLASSLGCVLPSPFATLSFLALPVIPELRLTDKGLVDVVKFELLK